jgi:hypothetical protein
MKRFLFVLALACAPSAVLAEEPNNPLFDDLLTKGVPVPGGPTVKLPAPLFQPGPAPADYKEKLEKAAGRLPTELFLKRTINAPYSLKINSVDKAGNERCAQMIDLTFVAYGKLDAVLETDLIKQFLGGKAKSGDSGEGATPLTSEELAARHIRTVGGRGLKEQYGKMALPLLEKVRIEGVMRTVRTNSPNAIVSATRMDDRFKNDKEYPNIWRHITVGEEEKLGPPHPYGGMAGYVVVTRLPEPKDALLVEMHYLLPEPPAWFDGRNLLRSKMPVVIQDNVRSFRRKLTQK